MKIQYGIVAIMVLAVFMTGCTTDNTETTGNAAAELDDGSATSAGIVDNPDKVVVYFFWGDGCPHCATEKPFLEEMEEKYPEVEVKMFETWKNPDNAELFQKISQAHGFQASGVPTTFIGDEHWVGYAEYMASEMENKMKDCIENGCVNPGDKLQE